jgi:alpha-amylase
MVHSFIPLFLLLLVVPSFAGNALQWSSRSIYQVYIPSPHAIRAHPGQLLTDRYALTDGSSPACDTSTRKYCGGTWKGITNNLNYIQNMGFDAVWISPIVLNIEGETAYGEAYHG